MYVDEIIWRNSIQMPIAKFCCLSYDSCAWQLRLESRSPLAHAAVHSLTQKITVLADSEEDLILRAKALNILGLNSSAHHKIAALLALPNVP